jgi:hypothetical protein
LKTRQQLAPIKILIIDGRSLYVASRDT